MRKLILALAGVAILAATPAAAASCIRNNDISNWSSINDKTLILENYRHQKWMLKLIGSCSNFKYHQRLVIKSFSGFGLSCVEQGDTIITRELGSRGSCAIVSITPYTPPPKDSKPDTNANTPAHSSY